VRLTDYSLDLADRICEQVALGKSMRTICDADDMPAMSSVFKWLRLHPEFAEQYARAKDEAADAMAEDILDIADDGRNDWMEIRGDEDAGWKLNGEHVQRSKLRVDARKWLAAKLKPKKYGERISTELTGKDGGPVEMQVNRDQLLSRIGSLAARAAAPQPDRKPE
jgi:hypothetical protein